jgi:hypothetical protein
LQALSPWLTRRSRFSQTKALENRRWQRRLCAGGATLITDDMLPVHPHRPVTAWPSMPAVRLLHDSASHLRYASGATHR